MRFLFAFLVWTHLSCGRIAAITTGAVLAFGRRHELPGRVRESRRNRFGVVYVRELGCPDLPEWRYRPLVSCAPFGACPRRDSDPGFRFAPPMGYNSAPLRGSTSVRAAQGYGENPPESWLHSSLADLSLAFRALNRLEMEGPAAPIASTNDSSPNGSPQGGALQTFLQKRKKRAQFACAAASAPLAYGARNRPALFYLKSACWGSPTKAESNSHCLGRETVALVRWIFPPVCSHCTACVKRDLGHSR